MVRLVTNFAGLKFNFFGLCYDARWVTCVAVLLPRSVMFRSVSMYGCSDTIKTPPIFVCACAHVSLMFLTFQPNHHSSLFRVCFSSSLLAPSNIASTRSISIPVDVRLPALCSLSSVIHQTYPYHIKWFHYVLCVILSLRSMTFLIAVILILSSRVYSTCLLYTSRCV